MRPISAEMTAMLAVHGDSRVYEMQPQKPAREAYSCEELTTNRPLVYCASPELAVAITKFLKSYMYEFRDGAPIIESGYMFMPEFEPTRLADAKFGIRTVMVGDDELIAKTMLEAIYILGYAVCDMPKVM